MKDNPKHIRAQKEGKTPAEFIPFHGLNDVAWVMASGAEKYGVKNWRIDKIKASTYIGAVFRHFFDQWASGVDTDEDSGRHPLAHVIACCLIIMDAEKHGTLIDDRLLAESKDPDLGVVTKTNQPKSIGDMISDAVTREIHWPSGSGPEGIVVE